MRPLVLTVEDLRTKAKRTYVVHHSPLIVGRDPSLAELVIGRPSVSRGQGEFIFDDQRVAYLDHGGRNVTLLGAGPINPHDEVELAADSRLLIGGEVEITFARVPPAILDEGDDPFACESAEFEVIRKEPTAAVSLDETRVLAPDLAAPLAAESEAQMQRRSRIDHTAILPAEVAATIFRASLGPIVEDSRGAQWPDGDRDWQEMTTFLGEDSFPAPANPLRLTAEPCEAGVDADAFAGRAGLTRLLDSAESQPMQSRPAPTSAPVFRPRVVERPVRALITAGTPATPLFRVPVATRFRGHVVSLAIVAGTAIVVATLLVFLALL